ncbi:MAG: prolyl oligopeptidase family serine peptidase, partial [Emcibacter sp.]|nr:prolyl oligopeptidase family serine peptidase [Emcibacter sp.]
FSIEMFLGGKDFGPESLYLARSPITYAEKVKTPTMIICGELDRSTPPSQAVEFHHALTLSGGTSVLVTYPGEGHGVRQFPAVIDFVSRILDWFGHHMPIDGLNGGVLPERAEMGSTSNVSTNVETSPVG